MNPLDLYIRRVWKQRNLLRNAIILHLLKENPGLTKGKLAEKVTGHYTHIPDVKRYINELERDKLIISEKQYYPGPYGHKKVYSITNNGLKVLEDYKQDIIAVLHLD